MLPTLGAAATLPAPQVDPRDGGQLELHVTLVEGRQGRFMPCERCRVGFHFNHTGNAAPAPGHEKDLRRVGMRDLIILAQQVTEQIDLMNVVIDEFDEEFGGRLIHVPGLRIAQEILRLF